MYVSGTDMQRLLKLVKRCKEQLIEGEFYPMDHRLEHIHTERQAARARTSHRSHSIATAESGKFSYIRICTTTPPFPGPSFLSPFQPFFALKTEGFLQI